MQAASKAYVDSKDIVITSGDHLIIPRDALTFDIFPPFGYTTSRIIGIMIIPDYRYPHAFSTPVHTVLVDRIRITISVLDLDYRNISQLIKYIIFWR
jgi:hypothetical protein